MIDESRVRKDLEPKPKTQALVWEHLSVEDLVAYRDKATAALAAKGALTMQDLNVEQELLLQLHALRRLQNDTITNEDIPVNQRATVANSVGTVIANLANLQVSVYSSERIKRIENVLVRHLTSLPEDVAAKFLDDYEKEVTTL